MKSYIPTYEQFTNLVKESLTFTEGIKQRNVPKTIDNIKENLLGLLRLKENDISFVGSAGKKKDPLDISYNINLGVCRKKLIKNNNISEEHALNFVVEQLNRLKYESEIDKDKNTINVNWPIHGRKQMGYVELKIKVTDNLDWFKFARTIGEYNENNKYTSKHRELFFEAIAEEMSKKVREYVDNKGNVKTYDAYMFEAEDGLHIHTKTFLGRNGKLQKSNILEGSKRLVSDKPKKVIEKLLGKNVNPEDVMNFEQIWDCFLAEDFPYKKKRNKIIQKYIKKLSSRNLEIPECIKK